MSMSNCMSSPDREKPQQFILHHNRNSFGQNNNHNKSYQSQGHQGYNNYNSPNQNYSYNQNHNNSVHSVNYGNEKIPNFYSPEELRIMRENVQKVVNLNISQTYSIAIIILEIATSISG